MTRFFAKNCIAIAFGLLSIGLATGLANGAAAQARISVDKNVCTGNPSDYSDPANCPLAPETPKSSPVYYVIKIANLPGESFQILKLMDTLPGGFSTTGAITCKNQSGAAVTIANGGAGSLGQIGLDPDAIVTCFVPGSFANTGPTSNTVTVTGEGPPVNATANTTVMASTPLNANITITKSASAANVDVTNGLATVTYTVTVKNDGSVPINIGSWFKLHDAATLNADSWPLQVRLLTGAGNFSCTSTSGTDCLDTTAGPIPAVTGWRMLSDANPVSMFTWVFQNGSAGHMAPGGSFMVTFKFEVKKLGNVTCTKGSDGFTNTAHFTLTNAGLGTSVFDSNTADNRSSAAVAVKPTNAPADPNCACGKVTLTKKQVAPPAGANPLNWPATVSYEITIKNTLAPNQPLTINLNNLKDFVVNGVNTPPFKREFIGPATCVSSTLPVYCNVFNAGSGTGSTFKYSFYGQSNLAWQTGLNSTGFSLLPGHEIKVLVTFRYSHPDCDSVPNYKPKDIVNRARLDYLYTPFGGGPQVSRTALASITTTMKPPPAGDCKFRVWKTTPTVGVPAIKFGIPTTYRVEWINDGPARTIGTVADMVRFTNANYATPLKFSSSWTCDPTPVGNVKLSGSMPPNSNAGFSAANTFPASPAVDLRLNPLLPLNFPAGAALKCKVTITVHQPTDNPNCTAEPAYFENVAFMDTTHPFNTNALFNPSGNYTFPVSPTPQVYNWASVRAKLPICYEVNLNKSASVAGLPPNTPAWTYSGGPPVDYAITVHNVADSELTGLGSFHGLAVTDTLSAPYSKTNAAAGTPVCTNMACNTTTPFNPKSSIGIMSLLAHQSGLWKLVQNGPFTPDTTIKNCATAGPMGQFNSWGVYNNASTTAAMSDCAEAQVVKTATLSITKEIVNQVGAAAGTSFAFPATVSCSPLGLPVASSNVTLNGIVGSSGAAAIVSNVPVGNSATGPVSCTVTESAQPVIPASLKCPLAGSSPVWIMSPPVTIPIQAGTNAATVKNVLTCNPKQRKDVSFKKAVVDQTGSGIPASPFQINIACTGGIASATTLNISHGQTLPSTIEVGASCMATEPAPPIPTSAQAKCLALGKSAAWETTFDRPMPLAVMDAMTVNVTNTLKCVP